MKLPESTATTRSAGSRSSSAMVSVRGVDRSGRRPRRRRGRPPAHLAGRCARPAPGGAPSPARAPTSGGDRTGGGGRCRRPRRGRPAGGRRARRRRGRPGRRVARSPISRPWRMVHMLSAQPQPTTRSAPGISSAASGVAKPPLHVRSHGLPRNRPLATAEVASSAPQRSASASSSARACAGTAPGDEHRPPRRRQQLGERRARRASDGAGAARGRRRRSGTDAAAPGSDACLHVERQVEHAPYAGRWRPCGRPRRCPRPPSAGERTRHGTAPTAAASASWSTWKLRRTASVGLAGEHEQRRAALGRLGDAGHRVGEAAALVDGDDADLAADPGVRVGHRRGAALVAGGDEADAVRDEGVGDVEVAAADHAERVPRPGPGEDPADGLGDAHVATVSARPAPARAPGCPSRRRSAAAGR